MLSDAFYDYSKNQFLIASITPYRFGITFLGTGGVTISNLCGFNIQYKPRLPFVFSANGMLSYSDGAAGAVKKARDLYSDEPGKGSQSISGFSSIGVQAALVFSKKKPYKQMQVDSTRWESGATGIQYSHCVGVINSQLSRGIVFGIENYTTVVAPKKNSGSSLVEYYSVYRTNDSAITTRTEPALLAVNAKVLAVSVGWTVVQNINTRWKYNGEVHTKAMVETKSFEFIYALNTSLDDIKIGATKFKIKDKNLRIQNFGGRIRWAVDQNSWSRWFDLGLGMDCGWIPSKGLDLGFDLRFPVLRM